VFEKGYFGKDYELHGVPVLPGEYRTWQCKKGLKYMYPTKTDFTILLYGVGKVICR